MTLEELRKKKPQLLELAKRYGVCNIRVFGSIARGDQTVDSDIDLLVDLDKDTSLMDMAAFVADAQDMVGARLDIVPATCLYHALKDTVLSEVRPL